MIQQRRHEDWIDVLTALSCLAVIYLHVNFVFWEHPVGMKWITSNCIECLFYFAVPVFFMITGYKFLDYRDRYDTCSYLKSRISRVFIPFFFWSIIFYVKKHHSVHGIILGVLNTEIVQVYWFFPSLFICYIGIIFLSLLPDKIKNYQWLFLWAFITYSIIPFLRNFGVNLSNVYDTTLCGGDCLFILLGYILGHRKLTKIHRTLIYILGISGFLLHCMGTIYVTQPDGDINKLFKGYKNFPSVFYASAIFVFCKYTDWSYLINSKNFSYCLSSITSCSLGIYLIHHYFVYRKFPKLFARMGIPDFATSEIWRWFGPIVIVTCMCFILKTIGKIVPTNMLNLFGIVHSNSYMVKK